jgi:hypothetical protein
MMEINRIIKKFFPNGWFHYQNLNDFPDGSLGPPIEGRCWLNFDLENSLYFSWFVKSNFCHLGLSLGDYDEKIVFKVAFPPIALWFGANIEKLSKLIDKHISKGDWYAKNTEISIHDGSIWWRLFVRSGYWNKNIPRWRHGNFNVIDFILGENKYTNRVLKEEKIDIPMPEGNYPATIKMEMATWKRPRWFAKRLKRADIEMEKPIPFPGKGENSWDCGDDACYGMTTPARSIGEAIGKMVEHVLDNRLKRGGPYKWNR